VLPTTAGDLIRFGSEVFLPTVYYRIRPPHAQAAKRAAEGTDDTKDEGWN
jgi:hypothetical protein